MMHSAERQQNHQATLSQATLATLVLSHSATACPEHAEADWHLLMLMFSADHNILLRVQFCAPTAHAVGVQIWVRESCQRVEPPWQRTSHGKRA